MSIISHFPQGGGGEAGIPIGFIGMWSGAANAIPEGWALCNGSNGTPDLRGRFVLGAGGAYAVGAAGGAGTHRLTVAEMPSHSHGIGSFSTSFGGDHAHGVSKMYALSAGEHSHSLYYVSSFTSTGFTTRRIPFDSVRVGQLNTNTDNNMVDAGAHTHTLAGGMDLAGTHSHAVSGSISSAGSSQAHNNMPPYYALCYIMKL